MSLRGSARHSILGIRHIDMLHELIPTRQVPGEPRRRWFTSPNCDLIVWMDGAAPSGFQLCYDKDAQEHALTWRPGLGFSHMRVSDGRRGSHKGTPFLEPDGRCDPAHILEVFNKEAAFLPREYVALVEEKVRELGLL